MRKCILLIFSVINCSLLQAQTSVLEKEKLLQIVRSYDEFPLYDDTCGMGNIHQLMNCSSGEEYVLYAHDSSVILRYIGFKGVLNQSDERAFMLVQEFKYDSSEIIFRVPCILYENYHYNELLFLEYYQYLYYTYKEGMSCCDLMGQFWASGMKDLDKFKKRRKQLIYFLKKNSLSKALNDIKVFDQLSKEK